MIITMEMKSVHCINWKWLSPWKLSLFIALIGNDYYQEMKVCFIALIEDDYYHENEVCLIAIIGSCIMYSFICMKWSGIVFFWNNYTHKGSQTLPAIVV